MGKNDQKNILQQFAGSDMLQKSLKHFGGVDGIAGAMGQMVLDNAHHFAAGIAAKEKECLPEGYEGITYSFLNIEKDNGELVTAVFVFPYKVEGENLIMGPALERHNFGEFVKMLVKKGKNLTPKT